MEGWSEQGNGNKKKIYRKEAYIFIYLIDSPHILSELLPKGPDEKWKGELWTVVSSPIKKKMGR